MRVSLSGKSCLGVFAVVVVATAFLGSDAATSKVSGNKINLISSYLVLLVTYKLDYEQKWYYIFILNSLFNNIKVTQEI
jgi:hypothetical protein